MAGPDGLCPTTAATAGRTAVGTSTLFFSFFTEDFGTYFALWSTEDTGYRPNGDCAHLKAMYGTGFVENSNVDFGDSFGLCEEMCTYFPRPSRSGWGSSGARMRYSGLIEGWRTLLLPRDGRTRDDLNLSLVQGFNQCTCSLSHCCVDYFPFLCGRFPHVSLGGTIIRTAFFYSGTWNSTATVLLKFPYVPSFRSTWCTWMWFERLS